MKILILGAQGNLGNELMGVYNDLNPIGLGHADLDITDEKAVADKISEIKPDVVFNCVAYNAVDKAEEERILADNVNGYGVGNIARACKDVDATLVHFSSGMVFKGDKQAGYEEEDPTNPVNTYGRSKMLGEMEAQENCEKFYIVRTCWLFGDLGPGATSKKSFADLMLEKAANKETINMVDDEFGNPTYTLDLAQASRALIEENKPFGIYHIANNGVASRWDWAKHIFHVKNLEVAMNPIKGMALTRAAKRPHYEVLNNTKFLELRPWTEALEEYLNS